MNRYLTVSAVLSFAIGLLGLCFSYIRPSALAFAFDGREAHIFGFVILLAGCANGFFFVVAGRMCVSGFKVELLRWPRDDYRMVKEYWRIAPERGWSRMPLIAGFVSAIAMFAVFFSG